MFEKNLTVKRVINNNIVIAENGKGQEIVAIGKGLGYCKDISSYEQFKLPVSYIGGDSI